MADREKGPRDSSADDFALDLETGHPPGDQQSGTPVERGGARKQRAIGPESPRPMRRTIAQLAGDRLVLDDAGDELQPEQEFFIPVHGFVTLTEDEVAVVNHPAFQRLGMVYQLGQANLVYRGATHRRLEHVLGTVYMAERMLDAVEGNHKRAARHSAEVDESTLADAFSTRERAFVRLGALLHDIGHLPEGHTLEDELGFLGKHDAMARLNLVFDRTDWPGGSAPSLRSVVNERFANWVSPVAITPFDVLAQIIAKDPSTEMTAAAAQLIRVGVCRDLVGNTICADLLDYLHRDWYHIGKPKHVDERLLHYLEIRNHGDGTPNLVISLGRRPKIRTDAISAILGLLEARYELAESVLFHRTKCSAAAMLERALNELGQAIPPDGRDRWRHELEIELLDLSDEGALDYLVSKAEEIGVTASCLPLNALRQRRIYKGVSTTFWSEIPGDIAQRLIYTYTESSDAAGRRNASMRMLEEDFQLTPGSLAMYCPSKGMNAKVAEVKIHVGGWIETLAHWDGRDHDFTGGHLEAQLNRFRRLWRIHVCLERGVWDRLNEDMRQLLRQAIQVCILGVSLTQIPLEASVKTVARGLAMVESPYRNRVVRDQLVGTRSSSARMVYPSGAPTIRSYFADV